MSDVKAAIQALARDIADRWAQPAMSAAWAGATQGMERALLLLIYNTEARYQLPRALEMRAAYLTEAGYAVPPKRPPGADVMEYGDRGTDGWTVEEVTGEIRDHGDDGDRVDFRDAAGRPLQIAEMVVAGESDARVVRVTLREVRA